MLNFFTTSTNNLLAAEAVAGVGHHVALTIVGTNRPQNIPYFRAKTAQEKLIRESGMPYSLVHATQFFEFLGSIADISMNGDSNIHLPGALIQPIAAEDVATAVARTAAGGPLNGESRSPDRNVHDGRIRPPRTRVPSGPPHRRPDPDAQYYGAQIDDRRSSPSTERRSSRPRSTNGCRQPAPQLR